MMRMKTVLAALGLLALAGGAMAQTDVIAERRAGLKRMGGHMEAIKPVVEASARAAARWAGSVPARVPQKTATERICWGIGLSGRCGILPRIGAGRRLGKAIIAARNERDGRTALASR